jgi:hypothetical protein
LPFLRDTHMISSLLNFIHFLKASFTLLLFSAHHCRCKCDYIFIHGQFNG